MKPLATLRSRFSAATGRIATRLRLVLVLIGLVIAAAGIAAALQSRTILSAHAQLNDSALPALALAQRTERDLNAMFLVLEKIGTNLPIESIESIRPEIMRKTQRVRDNLEALQAFDVPSPIISELDGQLRQVEVSSLKVIENHAALFHTRDDIENLLAEVIARQEQSHRILEDLSFEISRQTDSLLRAGRIGTDITDEEAHDLIPYLFLTSLNLSNIGFGLDNVVNITVSQEHQGDTDKSDRAWVLLNGSLRGVIGQLSQLPDTAARRELATHVAEIRELLIGEEGLFARLKLQHRFQQEFDANRAAHLPLMAGISNMSNDLVVRTLAVVDQTSLALDQAITQLVWVLTGTLLFAMATVSLTNHTIIERQFNRRIRSLNHAVNAIAAGELDHPINVSGADELGDMARALVVFKENAEDLRRSNIELEKFAYVAAHDLRSPLRAIHDLSTWAIEDEENTLSVESQAYMSLLQKRVLRLSKLLDDLLDYARVGQHEPEPELVDIEPLVSELAQYADPNGRFAIRCTAPDMRFMIQRTPLQQILGNLLNNAVKHHDRDQGRISVWAELSGDTLILAVEDDGPGIEPRYQERVFELFQTLRPRDEVEGSGLGLAIVKKLVTRQKGQVTMASDPATRRGATFRIVLPLDGARPAQTANIAPRAAA